MSSVPQDTPGHSPDGEQVSLPAACPNQVIVYISSDVALAIDCIARMIALARPPHSTSEDGHTKPPGPIQIEGQGRTSWWQLVTKYYRAVLCIKVISLEESLPTDYQSDFQALAVILAAHEQDLLLPLLNRLSSSTAESRLVIIKSDGDQIAEDDWWNGACSGLGFECHSTSDLGEASMSWQCCPWPSIQQCPTPTGSSTGKPLLPSTSSQIGLVEQDVANRLAMEQLSVGDGFHGTAEPTADARRGSISNEADGFEDDFAPFVSAEGSSTWEASASSDDLPTTTEIDETARMLFGHANSKDNGAEQLNDFGGLVEHLNQLKQTAALMDDASRRRFAAKVAMAVEQRFGSE